MTTRVIFAYFVIQNILALITVLYLFSHKITIKKSLRYQSGRRRQQTKNSQILPVITLLAWRLPDIEN